MARILATNWRALALRGVCAVSFGIVAFAMPAAAIAAFVILFGAYALADGVLALVSEVRAGQAGGRWSPVAAYGVSGVMVGIWAFVAPVWTMIALVALVAAWAVITGALEIAATVRLRRTIRGEWLLGLDGVISLLLGAVLVIAPLAGVVVLTWWIGAFVLVSGLFQLALAFKFRRWLRLAGAGARYHLLRAA